MWRSSRVWMGLGVALTMASANATPKPKPEPVQIDCSVRASEVLELDAVSLLDLFNDILEDGTCIGLRADAETRLDELLAQDDWSERDGGPQIAGLSLQLAEERLRHALTAGEVDRVRNAIAAVQERQAWMVELEGDPHERGEGHFIDQWQQEEADRLASIEAILDGESVIFDSDRIATPRPDWTLFYGRCGTGTMLFLQRARHIAGVPHALLATGQPELALQALLHEQWVPSLELGMTPPLLREFSERAFGAGSYEMEVARALAGLELRSTPLGWEAEMPLFGITVPLPVAVQSWLEAGSKPFAARQQLAEWVEQRLLPELEYATDAELSFVEN